MNNIYGELKYIGRDLLTKLTEQVSEYAKVEVATKLEGRQMIMILVPN